MRRRRMRRRRTRRRREVAANKETLILALIRISLADIKLAQKLSRLVSGWMVDSFNAFCIMALAIMTLMWFRGVLFCASELRLFYFL